MKRARGCLSIPEPTGRSEPPDPPTACRDVCDTRRALDRVVLWGYRWVGSGRPFMSTYATKTLSRRGLLAGVGLMAAAFGLPRVAFSKTTPTHELLGGIVPGMVLDRWTVVAVHPVKLGAIPVVLSTREGARFQVDVMARDPQGPSGIAETEHLALYLRNRGNGGTATNEEQGLGTIVLARELRTREAQGMSTPPLLTLRERHRRHPDGSFGVPLA
jgi:hypothetical protein